MGKLQKQARQDRKKTLANYGRIKQVGRSREGCLKMSNMWEKTFPEENMSCWRNSKFHLFLLADFYWTFFYWPKNFIGRFLLDNSWRQETFMEILEIWGTWRPETIRKLLVVWWVERDCDSCANCRIFGGDFGARRIGFLPQRIRIFSDHFRSKKILERFMGDDGKRKKKIFKKKYFNLTDRLKKMRNSRYFCNIC